MQKSMGSASNSNSNFKLPNNNNNFRVQRGGVNNNKRGMNNIFDGNKLAGSSTFNGLGNTQSKLGNTAVNWMDPFNMGQVKKMISP